MQELLPLTTGLLMDTSNEADFGVIRSGLGVPFRDPLHGFHRGF